MMSFHVGSLGFLTHFIYENHEHGIRRVIDGMRAPYHYTQYLSTTRYVLHLM